MRKKYSLINSITVLLFITIITGLINTEYFYIATSSAYYTFCFSTLVLAITTSLNFYLNNNKPLIFTTPILFFGLWCLFVVLKYFPSGATSLFPIYFIVHLLFINSSTKIVSNPTFNLKSLFFGITGIALLESLYCIVQYMGWFNTQNELFEVTGSCINPNTTAMFLATTVPIFLFLFQSKYKRLFQTALLTLLIALMLLKCRAAFIGAMASAAVFYGLEYNFIGWLKNKKNRITAKALVVLCLLILIPLSTKLYNSKKASSDGRKFIWKLSMEMIPQKPLFGFGYGFYSKEYNLFQADYIQKGKATITEMENAGYVLMAHNDFIQNAVEGGIIGFVLMLFFFGSLLYSIKNQKKVDKNDPLSQNKNAFFNVGYAGVVAFLLMATINFSIQNIPVMGMLSFYTAIICSNIKPIRLPIYLSFIETNKSFKTLLKISTIAICLFLAYTLFGIANADHLNKKAAILKKEGKYSQALVIMPELESYLNEDSDYWKNYGSLYYQLHNYPKAIRCLKKATQYDSAPALYLGLGICYEQLNQYPTAIAHFTQLVNLKPSKFAFRSCLMNAYLQNRDTANALKTAHEVLELNPKVPSNKVQYYKNEARKIVNLLSEQSSKLKNPQNNKPFFIPKL